MRAARTRTTRRGFTLIELLVVVGIIVTLLAIGLAAGSAVLGSAKRTASERLLVSIQQGLEQFKADHGYLPPLLNPHPSGATPGALVSEARVNAFSGDSLDPVKQVNYRSDISLAAYLIGVGDINGDRKVEYNAATGEPNLDDGVNGAGLRSPGPDKSWGGATNRPQGPQLTVSDPPIPPQEGRVYGPYVNFANTSKAMRSIPSSEVAADRVHRLEGAYQFLDRWGGVIRYYRHIPVGTRQQPTLDGVPAELLSKEAAEEYGATMVDVQPTVDAPLLNAEYVLLSAGPDGLFGDRETESATIDPQDPRYLTAAGGRGIGQSGPLSPELRKRVVRRISDNLRLIP